MFANIMFYNVTSPTYDEIIYEELEISLEAFIIGIESAIIIVPINGLIMLIFRNVVNVEEGAFVVHYGGEHGNDNIDVRDDIDNTKVCGANTDDTDSDCMSVNNKVYVAKTADNDWEGLSSSDSDASSTHAEGYIITKVLHRLTRTRLTSRKNTITSGNAIAASRSSSKNNKRSNSNRSNNRKRNTNRNSNRISVSDNYNYRNKVSFSRNKSSKINISGDHKIIHSSSNISIKNMDWLYHPFAGISKWFALPWWCVYIAWTLTVITCLVSSFFVIVYGLSNTHYKNVAWTLSFFLSTSGDVCVIQPFRVAIVVMITILFLNRPVKPTIEAKKLDNLGKYMPTHNYVELPLHISC